MFQQSQQDELPAPPLPLQYTASSRPLARPGMASLTQVVGANVDTFIGNAKMSELPEELREELDRLKAASQEADDDLPTSWSFEGETLYIKAHGSGRHWRYILHCPSLHLDVGLGRPNGIVGKARLASAFLWEEGCDLAVAKLYAFLVSFYGEGFTLQVSEAHLCVDVAGWDLSLADAEAFLARARSRTSHLIGSADDEDESFIMPSFDVNSNGRLCTGYEFSKTAPHSCCLYDKTKEIKKSRKDWMQTIWLRNGWDGVSRVIRVEFRYERECLREMGVEDAFDFLDQLKPHLWAYSTKVWLRHTIPQPDDTNKARWPLSPVWQAVQQAAFYGNAEPGVRERKHQGNLRLICQMLAGCSTKAAALLGQAMPAYDDGANFLTWFYDWLQDYLMEKGQTFAAIRFDKQQRLGIASVAGQDHMAQEMRHE